jgi:RND family efflux transporter MFP subunit
MINKSKKAAVIVVVAAVVIGGFIAGKDFFAKDGGADMAQTRAGTAAQGDKISVRRAVPVVVEKAPRRLFEERLALQGTTEARDTALVTARLRGTIDAIFVDEGDPVVAGETVLFETDSLSAAKRVEIARRKLAVAGCSLDEKKASRDRVEADRHKATLDFHRFERLFKKSAVTLDAFERIESIYLQASAMGRHAESLVALAAEEERLAASALAIAEKDFADARVVAPINGRVSRRFMEPGEWGDPMKPVLRIDDLSVVEISAHISEVYYHRVVPEETLMRVRAGGVDLNERPVNYRSPTIHPSLRTFEIKGVVENPPVGVVPGAMAAIDLLLARREAFGVRRESIVMRSTGPVVFYVEEGAARMAEVETGFETDGYVEITGGALPPGVAVVTMGQFLLDDGTQVKVID